MKPLTLATNLLLAAVLCVAASRDSHAQTVKVDVAIVKNHNPRPVPSAVIFDELPSVPIYRRAAPLRW